MAGVEPPRVGVHLGREEKEEGDTWYGHAISNTYMRKRLWRPVASGCKCVRPVARVLNKLPHLGARFLVPGVVCVVLVSLAPSLRRSSPAYPPLGAGKGWGCRAMRLSFSGSVGLCDLLALSMFPLDVLWGPRVGAAPAYIVGRWLCVPVPTASCGGPHPTVGLCLYPPMP